MATGSIRTGQIAAELRAPDGRPTRSPRIVAFHDTPRGRYRTLRKTTKETDHLTVAPATPAALARSVNELFTELKAVHERSH
jgi:ESX secretion-associated protein EspG